MKLYLVFFLMGVTSACLTNTESGVQNNLGEDMDSSAKDLGNNGRNDLTMASTGSLSIPDPPVARLQMVGIKTLGFSWDEVDGAAEYKILESLKTGDDFVEIFTLPIGTTQQEYYIPLYQHVRSRYRIQSCNRAGCADSNLLESKNIINEGIGYFKAAKPDADDLFGLSISANEDGSAIVVGAPGEGSIAKGVNDPQSDDNSASNAGAVYLYKKVDGVWEQRSYLKASNTDAGDAFGISTSISADGKTIAVGAPFEGSKGIGVNGNRQDDNSATKSGAVYVFSERNGTWSQVAYIKAANSQVGDQFGRQVSLSTDGQTLAVGAPLEDSNSRVIDQGQNDNSMNDSGAVYVFKRAGETWTQQAYLKTGETVANTAMGFSLAISEDGNRIAANHDKAVFIFERNAEVWTQHAKVLPDVNDASGSFGFPIALNGAGDTLVVGAYRDGSSSQGVNQDPNNNNAPVSGAAYVFRLEEGDWVQEAYLKSSNSKMGDIFGYSLSVNADGNILAISAAGESSSGTGVEGNQSDNNAPDSGAVYVFEREGRIWQQVSYLKSTNPSEDGAFGASVALSGKGNRLAVGAIDSSKASGIGGDARDTSEPRAGAFFLF